MTDQLAEIKAWLTVERAPKPDLSMGPSTNVLPDRWIDWLIEEVERLRRPSDDATNQRRT